MLSPKIPSFLITSYHPLSSPIISHHPPSPPIIPQKIKVLAFPSGKSSTLTITS